MEPMTLGSPVSSSTAASESLLIGSTMVPHYLPEYLTGGTTSASMSSSRGYAPGTSPKKYTKSSVGLGGHPGSPPSSYTLTSSTPSRPFERMASQPKPGGPPVNRLFERTGVNTSFQDVSLVGASGTPMPSTPQLSFGASVMATPMSTTVAETGETWVTVFGFPPSASSFILAQAAQWGHVVDHRIPPQGNWMHVKFASRLQAKKALTRNGKIFGETLMIGVIPCTDNEILDEARKENIPMVSSTPAAINASQLVHLSVTSPNASMNLTLDTSGMRPLAQAMKAAHSDLDVVQRGRLPQKNDGLVSKVMDYVFGW